MKKDSSKLRDILRRAERAEDDPEARKRLEDEGIYTGEYELVSKAELLEGLNEDDPDRLPSVDITVYLDETPVIDRDEIEDPLSVYIEESGIGEWIGSGEGIINDRACFDIAYSVHDLATAIPLIQRKLRELGAGPNTELSASDDHTYRI